MKWTQKMTNQLHTRMTLYKSEGKMENKGHNHSYIIPKLSDEPMTIQTRNLQLSPLASNAIEKLRENRSYKPVFEDVGKAFYPGMTSKTRLPVPLSLMAMDNVHKELEGIGPGVIDMKIKISGSDTIVLPKEFQPVRTMLTTIAAYEKSLNKDFNEWNMWILIDRRPIKAGFPQRNAGAHCDGFRMAEPYLKQASIYTWCNKLPTEATKSCFPLSSSFDPKKENYSGILTRDWDENDTVVTETNVLYRMDGHTPHRGKISESDMDDRVFFRVCFTPGNKEYNRLGNTPNPCLHYPENYWVKVMDPASRLHNTTKFNSDNQFIRMWENACQGHSSYGISGSGAKSHEQKLVAELKTIGPKTLNRLFTSYEAFIENNKQTNSEAVTDMQEMRLNLLKHRVW